MKDQPSMMNRCSILVADDEPTTLRLAAKWLGQAGHQVRQAADGQQALALIQEECPAILITDWRMPRLSGLELCRAVRREELPGYVYILLLTAKTDPEDVQEALAAGADDFLAKPTDENELLARVRQIEWSLQRRQEQVELAQKDPLTGVLNRRTFDEHCRRESNRAARYGTPLSCALLDLDLFKSINDTHGHSLGDAALKAVADVLSTTSRDTDWVCRYGGDEFCALLPHTDEANAARWAERVRLAIAEIAIPAADRHVRVKATIGVAQWQGDLDTPQELIDLADQALRTAKRTGRDRVQRFGMLSSADLTSLASRSEDSSRLTSVRARDIMTTPVVCLREDEPLQRAADLFLRLRINSAPVVDQQNRLVGIISEQDLLGIAISHEAWDKPVRDVMKTHVVCYEEDALAVTIWEFLRRVTIRRVVIVDNQVPTGVISRGGLLRWLGNWGAACCPQEGKAESESDSMSLEMLREATRSVREELTQLDKDLDAAAGNVVPCVVSRVTRMQERLEDLLALSQVHHRFQPDGAFCQ